jgi:putative transposase
MSSYRQNLHHLVFHTKSNQPTIKEESSKDLYNYIWGIVKNKNSKLLQINGIENHIHLLVDIHSSIALADFMRDLKSSSSTWIKESGKFPDFIGWAEGYGSFTVSYQDKDRVIGYIKKQKEHHATVTFEEEYREILKENGVEFDEKYFLK